MIGDFSGTIVFQLLDVGFNRSIWMILPNGAF